MISVERACKRFGEQDILSDVSLEICPGEVVFLLGRSGAGKSVLLKAMVRLLPLDSGAIRMDGQELATLRAEELEKLRRRCALIVQHPALMDNLSVFENMVIGLESEKISEEMLIRRAEETLEWVGLKKNLLNEPIGQLSFGLQKRVSLARSLILNPQYVLMDEPTTGMDPILTGILGRLTRELAKKKRCGVLVVSHDLATSVKVADRILLLHEGQIVFSGTPTEFQGCLHPLAVNFKESTQ